MVTLTFNNSTVDFPDIFVAQVYLATSGYQLRGLTLSYDLNLNSVVDNIIGPKINKSNEIINYRFFFDTKNGVVMVLRSVSTGAKLQLGPSGLNIALK